MGTETSTGTGTGTGTSTGTSTGTGTEHPVDTALVSQVAKLQDQLNNLMTKSPVLPDNNVTTANFASTFSSQATDSSIAQALSMGSKVGSAVTAWMNDPSNQATLKDMVQQGSGQVTAQEFQDLKSVVAKLQSGGGGEGGYEANAGLSGEGSGLTFNAAQEVGCVRWNWFHNKNTDTCYATACDPQKTDYEDGTCFPSRSSCTGTITPVRVIDGKCYASLTKDCTEADCQDACPDGDDAIIMPTQCAGPLILQDIYTPDTPAPQPLLQGGAFQDLTVQKTLTIGAQTGDASSGSTTGKLVINGDASLECPTCCKPPTAQDCPLTHPYAYSPTSIKGTSTRCCSVPASGGTAQHNPTTCLGSSIRCPKKTGCHAIQVNTTNPCPDCGNCAALSSTHLEVTKAAIGTVGDISVAGTLDVYNADLEYSNLRISPDNYDTTFELGSGDNTMTVDGSFIVNKSMTGETLQLNNSGNGSFVTEGSAIIKKHASVDGELGVGGSSTFGGQMVSNATDGLVMEKGSISICPSQQSSSGNSDGNCKLTVPKIHIFNDTAGVTSTDPNAPLYFSGHGDHGACYITSIYGCQSK